MSDIIHLQGNLHRVKTSLLSYADKSNDFSFFNPRHILDSSKPAGFSRQEMAELRESIRTQGLENPIIARWIEKEGQKVLQLVCGERRKRCIDKLIFENVDCYDPFTGTWVPAKQLYEYIDCRINNIDNKTAYAYAFSENETSVGIGDAATVSLVKYFRDNGLSDTEILQITSKSNSWLRETDLILTLDSNTFQSLINNEINRVSALKLVEIKDLDVRNTVLENSKSFAIKRLEEVKVKLKNDLENAESKLEVAKSLVTESEILGNPNQDIINTVNKLETKVIEKKSEIQEAEETIPKVTSKDIHNAKKELNNSESKSLTWSKIKKYWHGPINEIIKNNNEVPLEVNINDVYLIRDVLKAIEIGERDIISILQNHNKN